jgi:alanine dehydrogenase
MNLDEQAVAHYLDVAETIEAMRDALANFSAGNVRQPVRSTVHANRDGFLGVMPAYAGGALGVKLVTFFPGNADLPTHLATILLFDPDTGEPLVTMDGRLITEVRTAAVSAVATDLMARPDSKVLAILGAGVQAHSHLEALRLVRAFDEVRVWSPRRAAAFAAKHGVLASESAEEAVRGADVIVTATSSSTPVVQGGWLSAGAHINAVGACRPDWRELDDATLERARIIVDSREAAMVESGDVMAAGRIDGELGQVVSGDVPGRTSPQEITLFKSLGMAVEDVVTADLVFRKALASGRR